MEMRYENKGEYITVAPGIWHGCWIAARVKGNAVHRIKSKYLPPCQTREECQAYLDAYAKRKKWRKI